MEFESTRKDIQGTKRTNVGMTSYLEFRASKPEIGFNSLEAVSRRRFRDRVEGIVETAHGIGWSYYDTIESMLTQAQRKWDHA